MAKSKKNSKSKKNATNFGIQQNQQEGLNTVNKETKETDTVKTHANEDQKSTETTQLSNEASTSTDTHQVGRYIEDNRSNIEQETFKRNRMDFKRTENTRQPKIDSFYINKSRSIPYTRKSEPLKISSTGRRDDKRLSLNTGQTGRREQNRRYDSNFSEEIQTEFRNYNEEFEDVRNTRVDFIKTIEIEQDLFLMSEDYSLAHCVAEDMNMGSGIAVQFRREFKRVDELLNQHQETGGLAVLNDNDRFIYYLVTKRYSTGKPTYETLFASLQKLKTHVINNHVQKLAMPRIGCGLDRLQWDKVKYMIEYIFRDVDVEIRICNLQMPEGDSSQRHRNCKCTNVHYPIQNIEDGTIIVYLSTEDGEISEEMNCLNEKFNFLLEFRAARKSLGHVVYFNKNENYLLCGCIVKPSKYDPFSFTEFKKCLIDIQRTNKKYQFYYVGFQAIKDQDPCMNYKIINLLRNMMRDVEIYICWPGDLQDEMIPKDRYSDYTPKTSMEKSGSWRNSSPSKSNSFTRGYSSSDSSFYNTSFSGGGASTSQLDIKDENWDNEATSVQPQEDDWFADTASSSQVQASVTSNLTLESWYDEAEDEQLLQPKEDNKGDSSTDFINEDETWESNVPTDEQDSFEDTASSSHQVQASVTSNLILEPWHDEAEDTASSSQVQASVTSNLILEPCHDEAEDTATHSSKKLKRTQNQNFTNNGGNSHQMHHLKIDRSKNQSDPTSGYSLYIRERALWNPPCPAVNEAQNVPSKPYSQAYFVSEDMSPERSTSFETNIAPLLGRLLEQNQKEGGLAVVRSGSDYVYCLVVKKLGDLAAKPDLVFSSLQKMIDHARKNGVRKIVIPKITDLNNELFDWSEAKCMLGFLNKNTIQIVVVPSQQIQNKHQLTHSKSALHQMKKKSIICYLVSEHGERTNEIASLSRTFKSFVENLERSDKQLGNVIQYKENENYVLCGCIIKKLPDDPIDFIALQKCMSIINESKHKMLDKVQFLCIQAVQDCDNIVNFKIINILKHTLSDIAINMCWPGDLREKMPLKKA